MRARLTARGAQPTRFGLSQPRRRGPLDAIGAFLVSLGNIQEVATDIGVAHSLDLLPDDLRPLQVLFGAGLKRIKIVGHTPLIGVCERATQAPPRPPGAA